MAALSLVSVLTAGYVGAERIWYLRIWRGLTTGKAELWSYTTGFLGRYIALALIVFVPAFPIYATVGFDHSWERPFLLALFILVTIAFDLLITFATAALAFTTASAIEALKINFRVIKEHWPVSGYYMFVPSLAAVLLVRSLPRPLVPTALLIPLTLLSILANLLFKGATAAFYLHHHPGVPDDGAVDMSAQPVRDAPKTTAL